MRLTLVHNPSAGDGRPSPVALVEQIRAQGHELRYQSREDEGLEQAIAHDADALIIAGGDGTVSKLLPLLLARGLPIAILPLGTANNLARSLGIEGDPAALAAGWQPDRLRPLDICRARGPWGERLFVESAGWGALSGAMKQMHEQDLPSAVNKLEQARGRLRRALRQAPAIDPGVEIDGMPLTGALLALEVLSIASMGPRLVLAPDADPGDGQLDVLIVRASDRDPLAAWLAEGGRMPLPLRRARKILIRRPGDGLRVGDDFIDCEAETTLEPLGRQLQVLC